MADRLGWKSIRKNPRIWTGMRRLIWIPVLTLALTLVSVTGCGNRQSMGTSGQDGASDRTGADSRSDGGTDWEAQGLSEAPEIEGLTCKAQLLLEYAQNFRIYCYSDGYRVIEVEDSLSYLVVPKGGLVPAKLPEDMTVLTRPMERIYVAGTAAMAMFHALGGLDEVLFSGLEADGWYVDEAREAMEDGRIKFAGKYDEPDYEMLVDEGCDLAVESQMIHHSPKVSEMLGMMDIPVFIDCASNESHPLGRVEWIKVYGVLLGKEEEAEAFFKEQTAVLDELEGVEDTERSVVYFYINSGGQAVVRTGTDYIARMIKIAGGRYPFESLKDEKKSTAAISMEEKSDSQ